MFGQILSHSLYTKITHGLAFFCVTLLLYMTSIQNICAMGQCVFLSGSANPELAQSICQKLGVTLSDPGFQYFKNGEIAAQVQETVRGKHAFLMASFASRDGKSVNDQWVEYHLLADAVKRAGASTINAVLFNYPYARQDRRSNDRSSISASFIASTLENVIGIKHLYTVDLHADQIQGFFHKTGVDNLGTSQLFADTFIKTLSVYDKNNIVIVSPDAGGTKRAKAFKEALQKWDVHPDFAMMIKERLKPNEVAHTTLVGNVEGKVAVIIDDICDTGGTLTAAAKTLKDKGARDVYACITHPVFSDPALDRIAKSEFKKIFVTDTIPMNRHHPNTLDCVNSKITVVSVGDFIASVLRNIIEPHTLNLKASKDFIP